MTWNSIDAEASRVDVTLVRDEADAIKKVVISDDGRGIDRDEVEGTFGEGELMEAHQRIH
ncbi:hypothetical protein G5V58_03955 [Nocardioides anomalus]|uniref:ATP-binding protein n=1 Tax=Nocardioides anomalus TaxID=2712223 RepID=A0A6G6WKK5_9ACTN|nr:hypothetical protein G5V58_03955 [Nocardioides anomalus]